MNKCVKTFVVDGIEYCCSNKRMMYNPDFHDNHGTIWSDEDKAYMVQMKPTMKWKDLCMALGRTQSTCMSKYHDLKLQGKLEYYKNYNLD